MILLNSPGGMGKKRAELFEELLLTAIAQSPSDERIYPELAWELERQGRLADAQQVMIKGIISLRSTPAGQTIHDRLHYHLRSNHVPEMSCSVCWRKVAQSTGLSAFLSDAG